MRLPAAISLFIAQRIQKETCVQLKVVIVFQGYVRWTQPRCVVVHRGREVPKPGGQTVPVSGLFERCLSRVSPLLKTVWVRLHTAVAIIS
jgi:hypothetical protein